MEGVVESDKDARIATLEEENRRLRAEVQKYKIQHTNNQKAYNERNKEAIKKHKQEYYKQNRETIRKKQNEHYRSTHPNDRSDRDGNPHAAVVQNRDILSFL